MAAALEPVNVATPEWECPICHENYGEGYDAAKACAALGQPDGAGAADEIVVWNRAGNRHYDGSRHQDGSLEVVRLGPVKLVRDWDDETGTRGPARHALFYDDDTPAEIGVGYEPGEIIVRGHTHDTPSTTHAPRDGDGLDKWLRAVSEKFQGGNQYAESGKWPRHNAYDSRVSGYHRAPYNGVGPWYGPLTDEVRHVFEVLLTDQWERLVAVDPAEDVYDERNRLAGQWRWGGVSTALGHGGGFSFLLGEAAYSTACAHGFGQWDSIGVTRWLTTYKSEVLAWLHDRFYRWVHGEDVSIPVFTADPVVVNPGFHKGLPKKPNKKRVEALAHWGVDPDKWSYYRKVVDAALATIETDTPENPVPGVVDAVTYRRGA
jgi:hypothetical protein